MSYVESNLVPGETVIYQTRLHWIVMLGHIVVGCLLLALPGALLLYYAFSQTGFESRTLHIMEGGGLALLICGMVTIRRVVIKMGLAARKTIEMLLDKVESIEVIETTFGRMLGYGAIVVIGTGGTSEPFHKVAHRSEEHTSELQSLRH